MTYIRIPAVAAAAALAAAALRAQTPETFEQIPVIPGSRHDTKAEALLPPPKPTQRTRLYRIEGSIEEVFQWYHSHLGGNSGEPLDSPTVRVTGLTPVSYHIAFYTFADECADSTTTMAPDSATTPPCRKWRRGKDKRRALGLSRLPWDSGLWIEDVTFTWFFRAPDGSLRRLRVEIRDIGLKPDWRFYTPRGQVRFESLVLEPPTPAP
jgi:hypothetical protein